MAPPTRQELASVWPPTRTVSVEAGHKPMSPVQAIRRKCLDCSGYQLAEVKLCVAVGCSLWPFRAGRHPYTTRALQEADLKQRLPEGTLPTATATLPTIGLQDIDLGQGDENNDGGLQLILSDGTG